MYRLGIYLLLLVVFFLAGTKTALAQSPQPLIQTSVGDISFSFSKEDGVCLFYRGVNLIRRSTLVVHYGNWSAPYFTYVKGETTASIQPVEDGKEVVLNHSSDSFTGVHKIRIYPDKISFEFHGRMLQGISDGMMDYDLGFFSANPLAGCPFNAKGGDTPISSTFPLLPRKQDDYLFPQTIRSLEIDSRIGRISLDVTGDLAGLTCFDARRNHGTWAERSPIFWIGAFHQPLSAEKEYTHTVTLSFHSDPVVLAKIQKGEGSQVSVIDSKQVRLSPANQLLIIPEPKQLRVRSHDFTINSKTRIVVSKTATPKDLSGARLFCEDLATIYKLKIPIVREKPGLELSNTILIGELGRNQLLTQSARKYGLQPPAKKEGYALQVDSNKVLLLGHDSDGTFYGMQTLRQLIQARGSKVTLKGCKVVDWPSLRFRGVHLFIGAEAWPFHKKLIDRILTKYKFNTLVLESEYLQWDSAPDLSTFFSMPKQDLKKEIAYAKNCHFEVIPLVESLGHCEWMFRNRQNRDLAEDPQSLFAYCPSKKQTYDFIFKIYDEAIDLFKPRFFHIGHDEVALNGHFPYDEACKQKTVGDLLIGDIQKLHQHLSAKGIQVMMWGDMFLAPEETPGLACAPDVKEARHRRDLLPKDIIITDRAFGAVRPEEYVSTKAFNQSGYKTLFSTWSLPANIEYAVKAALESKSDGLMQTTWVGYNCREQSLDEYPLQFKAFVLAGEYAWSGRKTSFKNLPYQYENIFQSSYHQTTLDSQSSRGFLVDLQELYNTRLSTHLDQSGQPNIDFNLDNIPAGTVRLKGDLFCLGSTSQENSAIRLFSAIDREITYPNLVDIPLHRQASTLIFLHTCAQPDHPSRKVGQYRINYSDGTFQEISLIYNQNIISWNELNPCQSADYGWGSTNRFGQEVNLIKLEWSNPMPKKEISSVMLISSGTEAGITLLAVSGLY